MIFGVFAGDPSLCRFSAICAKLRLQSGDAAVKQFDELVTKVGRVCQVHGVIDDPIIGLVEGSGGLAVAIGCPRCSGEDVRKKWEAEAIGEH